MEAPFNVSHPANLMLSVTFGIIGSIGAPGNFFLLILIAVEYQRRKPHEWLLFLLALGDFLLCFHTVTMEAPFVIYHERNECKIAGVIDYLLGILNLFIPALVAYNRYLSLYDNQKYQRVFTNRNFFLAWGSIFLLGIGWIAPFVISGSLGQDDDGLCGVRITNLYHKAAMGVLCVSFFISYISLVCCSYKVIVKIKKRKPDASNQSRLQCRLISESQEIVTVLIIISTVPLFSQFPTAVMKLLHVFLPPFSPWITRAVLAPFPLTAALNAYVTIYIVKDYRNMAIRIFRKPLLAQVTPMELA